MKVFKTLSLVALTISSPAVAQSGLPEAFHFGTAIPKYGPVATIADPDMTIPEGTEFKIAFDVAKGAEKGKLNRTLESAARFINMHVEAGVPADDIKLAVVVHGSAVFDLTGHPAYGDRHTPGRDDSIPNPNVGLIDALREKSVRIIICGQSATAYGLEKDDFYTGVELALSAMTAHALLQQDGYTINPF